MPNITGSSYPITAEKTYYEDSAINEGALDTEIINRSVAGGGEGGAQLKVKFNARNGETKTNGAIKSTTEHKVYGASDDVQIKNTTIRLWRRTD